MTGQNSVSVTVAIPTYGRGRVLADALRCWQALRPAALLVVDQTASYEAEIACELERLAAAPGVRWLRLGQPSIPRAMNAALAGAESEIVLFVDDDAVPMPGLLEAHAEAHREYPEAWAVAGQVLQPREEPEPVPYSGPREGLRAFLDFPFRSSIPAWVKNVMAGNLSVNRERALAVGGFDENFLGSAFRFETEFARRLVAAGGRIRFEPRASVRHLRAAGGTRGLGSHLTSCSPDHGVGDYYFALGQGVGCETLLYMARRPLRQVATRFHLFHPWWIPVKLAGELRAMALAVRLRRRGPRHLGDARDP